MYALLLITSAAVTVLALVGCLLAEELGCRRTTSVPSGSCCRTGAERAVGPSQARLERDFRYRGSAPSSCAATSSSTWSRSRSPSPVWAPTRRRWGTSPGRRSCCGSCLLARIAAAAALGPRDERGRAPLRRRVLARVAAPRLGDLVNPLVVGAPPARPGSATSPSPAGWSHRRLRGSHRVPHRAGGAGADQRRRPRLSRAFREGLGLQALGVGVPTQRSASEPVAGPAGLRRAVAAGPRGPAVDRRSPTSSSTCSPAQPRRHRDGRLRVLARPTPACSWCSLVSCPSPHPGPGPAGFGVAGVLALWPRARCTGASGGLPPALRRGACPGSSACPAHFLPLVDGVRGARCSLPLVVVLCPARTAAGQLAGTARGLSRQVRGPPERSVAGARRPSTSLPRAASAEDHPSDRRGYRHDVAQGCRERGRADLQAP